MVCVPTPAADGSKSKVPSPLSVTPGPEYTPGAKAEPPLKVCTASVTQKVSPPTKLKLALGEVKSCTPSVTLLVEP